MVYKLLADAVVTIHFAYVAFVVIALPATIIGGWRKRGWVTNRWFRGIHLTMILIVVAEAWAGITCPLTTLEKSLRDAAGLQSYQGDFIATLMHDLMFFDLSPWAFTACYTAFGILVVATLIYVPPRWKAGVDPEISQDSSAEQPAVR